MCIDINFLFNRYHFDSNSSVQKPKNHLIQFDGIDVKSTKKDFVSIIDPFRHFNDVRVDENTIHCSSNSFRCNPDIFILKAPTLVFVNAIFGDDGILSQYKLSFENMLDDDSLPLQVMASSFIEIKNCYGDPCATEASCYHVSDFLNVNFKFQWEDEFSRVKMVRNNYYGGGDSLSIYLSPL